MTTSELGACEWFVWDLERSNLLDRAELEQLVADFLASQPLAEPPALAKHLVEQGVLTSFQADRILQKKSQGLVLGPYSLTDALGSGSMGTVYKASSKNDDGTYAIKVLPRRSMWNVRIARRQVRNFEQCRHPAVVPFVDAGTAGGTHYLVWPLVEGETLEKVVEQGGKLPAGVAALCLLQIAEGLCACHQQGIVHGLLKPSNILLGHDGQVRILDFGIGTLLANPDAESLVDTMSTANTLTSGLDCASPESILEPSDRTPAGDQYSLGCVLYYCLTGRYPFADSNAVEKMMAHQAKTPPPIREFSPEVPEGMIAVVDRLMEKKPASRYPDFAHVVDALRPWAASSMPAPKRAKAPPASASLLDTVTDGPTLGMPERASGSIRRQLSKTAAPPEPTAPPPTPPAPTPESEMDWDTETNLSFEDRLGPVGLFMSCVMAASVTWLLTFWMFK
jgi:serine/threonine-protein kinase